VPEAEITSSVLCVDDHHDTARLLGRLLVMLGYTVREAEGYAAALAAAKAQRFDILIADLGLKDGDGCDLMAAISALYPVKGIALTGYVRPEDRMRCEDAGFAVFLAKPFELDDLRKAMESLDAGSNGPDCPAAMLPS
jgi:CheY-like chemotaxis protein